MYPIGVGLFGHLSGLSWEACSVVKQCKNTVCPIVVCVAWKCFGKLALSLNHAKIQCILLVGGFLDGGLKMS